MIIVEDGSGVQGADSFLSVADAKDLADKFGISIPDNDKQIEQALRKSYLSLNDYESIMQGSRVYAYQGSIFPRSGVYANCTLVDSNVIPNQVKIAQLYMLSAICSGFDTNSFEATSHSGKLKSFNVQGVYNEEYFDSSASGGNVTKTSKDVTGVYSMLEPFLKQSDCNNSQTNLYRDVGGFCGI